MKHNNSNVPLERIMNRISIYFYQPYIPTE